MEFNQYGTRVVDRDGKTVAQSENLRAMRDYARKSPIFRVSAKPCPLNPYNGKLWIEYENGAQCLAHFACYTVLLEWLLDRRIWRTAPFWNIDPPNEKHGSERAAAAILALRAKGLA